MQCLKSVRTVTKSHSFSKRFTYHIRCVKLVHVSMQLYRTRILDCDGEFDHSFIKCVYNFFSKARWWILTRLVDLMMHNLIIHSDLVCNLARRLLPDSPVYHRTIVIHKCIPNNRRISLDHQTCIWYPGHRWWVRDTRSSPRWARLCPLRCRVLHSATK